jgi:serine/threonine protein kinase
MEHPPEQPVPLLPPGFEVGPWRVEAWHGQGAYGAVYRAVRVGQEQAGPVALKFSIHPWDGRMVREAKLLSRLDHPCVPRLLDQGMVRLLDNTQHPWFVMEWIDGAPLYAWAQRHSPSHREVCQLLAQLARALEMLHAGGAVHRDVKGDNVLVRLSDGRPCLIDFGSAHVQGEERLTWRSLPPFTLAYLSPQAALFDLSLIRQPNAYYFPSPADDLFALGVTAYRLVMGQYPPVLQRHRDDAGHWRVECPDFRPLLDSAPRVQPLLREWILRLLSQVPEERGSAALLAQALEAEAAEIMKAPQSARALASEPPPPAIPAAPSVAEGPRRSWVPKPPRAFRPWLALVAAAAVALVLWSQARFLPVSPEHVPASSPQQAQAQAPDAGTAAVGESASSMPLSSASLPSREQSLFQEGPLSPDPGQPRRQARPDAKGQCPLTRHVSFNGFCWVEQASMPAEECVRSGYTTLKGKCYAPVLELPQKTVPTSGPGKAR